MKEHSPTLRVIRIVDIISSYQSTGIKLSEIVEQLNIPKTTVFNILNTLVQEQVIEVEGNIVKKYKLGFQSFIIAKRYIEKVPLINVSDPILKELSDLTNMTSFIAKQDKKRIFYIYKHEANSTYRTVSNIGSENYIYSTSLGKAYLMTLNQKDLGEKVKELDYVLHTIHTVKTKEQLVLQTQENKKRGFTVDEEETSVGMICFGAPVYNANGEYEASISITGKYTSDINKELYGKLIKQAAKKISEELGYRANE